MANADVSPLQFSRDKRSPIDPDPELARLRREEGPVTKIRTTFGGPPEDVWLVTGHAEAREVLGSPHVSNVMSAEDDPLAGQPGVFLASDPPEHTRIRGFLSRDFAGEQIGALRPRVEEIVAEHLREMERAGPPADLMSAFANPVPSLVICELLGVPYADRADFQRRSDVSLDVTRSAAEQAENGQETYLYMAELVARHRRDPGDDILGTLVREHADDITDDELVGVGILLLTAGHETTANTIGLGTVLLLEHPDQLAILREEPGVVKTAVEEILRYLSVVNTGLPRRATADLEIGGRRHQIGRPDRRLPAGSQPRPGLPRRRRRLRHHPAAGHPRRQAPGIRARHPPVSRHKPCPDGAFGGAAGTVRTFPGTATRRPRTGPRYRGAAAVNGLLSLPVSW